jgi:hypothetical protein
MKGKILNVLLIITSLFGYLEWGKDNHQFLFQVYLELISKLFSDPASVIHPFTILPLLGQILLFATLFQRQPGKVLTFIGLGGLSILLLFMFLIGVISLNVKILLSTVPFLVVAVLTILHHRKKSSD